MVETGEAGNEARGAAGLLRVAAAIDGAGGPERRHETLMARAAAWGLERVASERVYALAEEEGFEPELGLLLAASGMGVTELEPVDSAQPEAGRQAAPPDWVAVADVAPVEAQRERRLRLSFRRFQALVVATGGSAVKAAQRFLGEPDVIEDAY